MLYLPPGCGDGTDVSGTPAEPVEGLPGFVQIKWEGRPFSLWAQPSIPPDLPDKGRLTVLLVRGDFEFTGDKHRALLHTREITAGADLSDISGQRRLGPHRLFWLTNEAGFPHIPGHCHLLSLAGLGGAGRAARLVREHLTWGG